ncbi:MAG: glutamate--tRNA ligase [Chloroflexi bacterium]|nr:glutamate--tRNA ligase [Chloroflexota bacterium]
MSSPARVRFAPSPTGRLHIGGARTALYDYLLARQTGGKFVIRIEDTDRMRFVPGAEAEIYAALSWLGMEWDEGPDIGGPYAPYRQSERTEIYLEHAKMLVDSDHAYYCFCTAERLATVRKEQQARKQAPRYDGLCRRLSPEEALDRKTTGESHVIRFKTPRQGKTTGIDAIRGEITVENASLDDYILLKSDGLPVYHLAAMVDDHLMEITHVLRTSEWLPTFPLHVLIYEAFDWEQPAWVHMSVLLNPSGKGKLSKRHGSGGAHAIYPIELKEAGYIPEAVVNWLALMGWSYDDRTEFFSMSDLIGKFSLAKLNASPAAVNFSKLDHFNGLHIRSLSKEDLASRLVPHFYAAEMEVTLAQLRPIVPLIQERSRTLDEAVEMSGFFFRDAVQPDPQQLIGKNMSPAESAAALARSIEVIQGFDRLDTEPLELSLRKLSGDLDLKVGQLFGILRVAVTGQRVSPPLIETMEILGKQLVLERLKQATELLESSK